LWVTMSIFDHCNSDTYSSKLAIDWNIILQSFPGPAIRWFTVEVLLRGWILETL
jgi:hypothetical protein